MIASLETRLQHLQLTHQALSLQAQQLQDDQAHLAQQLQAKTQQLFEGIEQEQVQIKELVKERLQDTFALLDSEQAQLSQKTVSLQEQLDKLDLAAIQDKIDTGHQQQEQRRHKLKGLEEEVARKQQQHKRLRLEKKNQVASMDNQRVGLEERQLQKEELQSVSTKLEEVNNILNKVLHDKQQNRAVPRSHRKAESGFWEQGEEVGRLPRLV